MNQFHELFVKIVSDERYRRNIEYGQPRRGHAEGKISAHIRELEQNLDILMTRGLLEIDSDRYWKLMVLIHVHDTFKAESGRDLPISDPNSHASLAAAYLATHTDDADLLQICQWHDLGYAIYRKFKQTGRLDLHKLDSALDRVTDIDLFLLFSIIDACTESKGREMITWLVTEVTRDSPNLRVRVEHIIPAQSQAAEGVW